MSPDLLISPACLAWAPTCSPKPRLRLFNIAMALALVASLYPVLA